MAAALVALLIAHGSDRRAESSRSGNSLIGEVRTTPSRETLRVGSFNIHAGRGSDGRFDLTRTAESLLELDVVGLNEVRGDTIWETSDQAAALAARLGLAWCFAPSERRFWNGHWGNALLSAWPVRQWEVVPLAGTRGKAYRNLVDAEVEFGTQRVHVLVTHIDTADDHVHQLAAVVDRFLALPEPAVLMGDMNARRDDPEIARLLATPGVLDCVGSHLGKADSRGRIDWIFARGLELHAAGVRSGDASDHPCVWAELVPRESAVAKRSEDTVAERSEDAVRQ
jgi:endonuclease/exonuclease/phosphatase family metal-dependent hydrolase